MPLHALTPTATTRGRGWIRVGVRGRDRDWNRERVRDRDRDRDRDRYRYRYRDRDRDRDKAMNNLSAESHPAPVSAVWTYTSSSIGAKSYHSQLQQTAGKKIFISFFHNLYPL